MRLFFQQLTNGVPLLMLTLVMGVVLLSGCSCGGSANNDRAVGLCNLAQKF